MCLCRDADPFSSLDQSMLPWAKPGSASLHCASHFLQSWRIWGRSVVKSC